MTAEDAAALDPVARLSITEVDYHRGGLSYVNVGCPHGSQGAFWAPAVSPFSLPGLVEVLLNGWRRDATEHDDECDTARVRNYVAQLRW